MKAFLQRQTDIISNINQIETNFKKDSKERKTPEYIQKRLVSLDTLWGEFQSNHQQLLKSLEKTHDYFVGNHFENTKATYLRVRELVSSFSKEDAGSPSRLDELKSKQRTNFRAFSRVINGIDIEALSERWELQDKLDLVQARWRVVDECHWQIDNLIEGADVLYEAEFDRYERRYEETKKELNRKLNFTAHLQQSTPKVEIPVFSGKYDQWPTFYDLYSETIHNSPCLTKSQKMQHLKSKLKGEAERLIKHLNTSSDNYDTAWDILLHRYQNPQLIFSQYIETFLNQPKIQKRTSGEFKRLYDTTMESINAIQNLGIDISTWDPIIVHLLVKKLDDESCTDYKESRRNPRELPTLEELLRFLENKYTALEPTYKKEKEDHFEKKPSAQDNKGKYQKYRDYRATATYTCKCPLCKQEHDLYKCKKFLNMTSEIKLRTIAKLNICKNCLFVHSDKNRTCNSTNRCRVCGSDHNTIIHEAVSSQQNGNSGNDSKNSAVIKVGAHSEHNVNYVAGGNEEILLTTLTMKVKGADGTFFTLRALLDQGSQISLISEHAAQLLGLKRQRYQASVSGIGHGSRQSKGIVTLNCQSIYNDYDFSTQALVILRVVNDLPNSTFNKHSWPHLQNINLADPEYNVSRPIDILLDASVYSDILMTGLVKGPSQAPMAQQTKMGWVLSGQVKTFQCNVVINHLDDIAKYWELENINEVTSALTNEEQYCEDLYVSTTRRLDNGRYEVALPMKPDFEKQLGSSRSRAVAQFLQMEKKMAKNSTLAVKYRKFMTEYKDLGHMHQVEKNDDKANYLPHHGVLKAESSTTSLRVVFNASQKTSSGHSLNDLMECGPNLQKDLHELILKWRQYKYVMIADIEKMFRQIFVRPSDRHLQSIIWRDDAYDILREYHLSTVTYGTKAAPYLAIRTLRQIASDNRDSYPLAAAALESSFYMDDLMGGHDSFQKAKELQQQLIEVLRQAGMNIRKWSSNDPELIRHLSPEQLNSTFEFRDPEARKTLGLQWNSASDTFSFQNKEFYDSGTRKTKRQLLSDISKVYDPVGWLSPLTIKAKVLFQKTWVENITWDDELPTDIVKEWISIKADLGEIDKFSIPRHLGNMTLPFQLHGFCDSSEKAYACVIFIVTQDNQGQYTSRLVTAKTKVSPHNKPVSLPRGELLGALLLAELAKKVFEALGTKDIPFYAWTDSMVVLGWLQGDVSRWKQFVANRVVKITDVIPSKNWRHVKSEDNPADCATRGMTATNLMTFSLWWTGPTWIQGFKPDSSVRQKYEDPKIEVKKSTLSVHSTLAQNSLITDILNKNSSITRTVRILAWVAKYIARLRKQQIAEYRTALTSNEIQAAYNLIARHDQSIYFAEDLTHIKRSGYVKDSSKISSLNPFLDDQGILRVGGRLANSLYSDKKKHPIILLPNSRFTELLINQAHFATLHGGPKLTLSYLRETFWVVSGIRAVKRQLRLCVTCKRHSLISNRQIMADLPSPRVTPSRPFCSTGVDFTGCVEIKANKGRGIKLCKGYIAVFVCLATKALHLELVSDMSTAGFLAAFRRFCARRGTPKSMYSDNGTNFVGAARMLKNEYLEIMSTIRNDDIINDMSNAGVTWHFNAPAWPTAGGLWEAAVKSVKFHLKRVLGEQRLTYEEFSTLLLQIEASLNSRPLCSITENAEDVILTPGHFLIGGPLLSRPQTEPDSTTLLTRRWQLVQCMNKQFWKLWSREYLQQLQVRTKWRRDKKDLALDDIVVIKEDNMPPGKWALGRVQGLHHGKDGHVRVVTLKTQTGSFKRPINKLILLPVNDQPPITLTSPSTSSNNQGQEAQQSEKRHRRARSFKNLVLTAIFVFLTFFTLGGASTEKMTYNITSLNISHGLYYDKISDLQQIKDEWKLVTYQNMSTYWQGLSDIKNYVVHLDELIDTMGMRGTQYHSVTLQLQHEINEIEHYNGFLLEHSSSSRQKRGLINGVGYIANSLFGVLDQQFAEQYKKDIEKISVNENHLQTLIRNQTLIIETELNTLQRNEQIMNNQFKFIKQVIGNLTAQEETFMMESQNGMYLVSSSLAANIMLTNLRRIQQTIIGTITDIRHGRFDTHLLSPEQLEDQVILISAQLQGDTTLPVDKGNIRDLYKLLKVHARIIDNFLITEIRIPIISGEIYELDKLIAIPPTKHEKSYRIIPRFPYIAVNLRKDLVTFLTDHDLQQCLQPTPDKMLCSIDVPMYELKMGQSMCDVRLVDIESKFNSPCIIRQHATCDVGSKWIKLRIPNVWLYSCCEECSVRIFCPAGIVIRKVDGNGLLTLGQGCALKGENFTLQSHQNFESHVEGQMNVYTPDISLLNTIKVEEPHHLANDGTDENHDKVFKDLRHQIRQLKDDSTRQMTIHDVHQYSVLYVLVACALLGSILYATTIWVRRRRTRWEAAAPDVAAAPARPPRMPAPDAAVPSSQFGRPLPATPPRSDGFFQSEQVKVNTGVSP